MREIIGEDFKEIYFQDSEVRVVGLSDGREDVKTVAVPTLVLECRQDVIASREVGAYVRDTIPGSRLVNLEATGYC